MEGTLWLLIYAALFYVMMRYGCGAHMVHGHGNHGAANRAGPPGRKDPVCGMDVSPDSGYSRVYQGREYRFCSRTCLDQFDRDPTSHAR